MLHSPLHLFDANAFYPHPLSLAFSDSLLGYGPAAFFGSGTVAALVRYNLLFLFAYSLCFVGAYLLARELGLGGSARRPPGVAFAYAPYRVTEAGHLHVISSGGIPLALFLLLRGYRRGSRAARARGLARLGLAGQPRLHARPAVRLPAGRARGCCVALGAGGAARAAACAADAAALGCAAAPPRRRAPLAAASVIAIYQARPYLKVSHDYPTAKRTIKEVKNYSSGPGRAALGLLGEPRLGRRHRRARATTSTPRTRTCSSPAG